MAGMEESVILLPEVTVRTPAGSYWISFGFVIDMLSRRDALPTLGLDMTVLSDLKYDR